MIIILQNLKTIIKSNKTQQKRLQIIKISCILSASLANKGTPWVKVDKKEIVSQHGWG